MPQLLEQFGYSTALGPLTSAADEALSAGGSGATGAGGSGAACGGRLCTLATALVDLPCAGRRLVAQSVIPGILSGDQVFT